MTALLDAASAVFAEAGYEAATTAAIANRADASIGSLYQFFPTKEHIAAALHERHLQALQTMLEELAWESAGHAPAQVIERLFKRFSGYLAANPAFLELGERKSLDPAVKRAARAGLRAGLTRVLAGMNPAPAPERLPALAALTLHLIRTAAMLAVDDDPAIRADAVTELRNMLRRHLAPATAA